MKKIKLSKLFLLIILSMMLRSVSMASSGWSWGVGYHNPPNSTIGLNFMHLWSQWAFELGIGYINSTESKSDNNKNDLNLAVAGDVNLKYLFGSGSFRPYLQGGTYAGVAAQGGNRSGASASVSGGFLGAGFFIMTSGFDFYLSYITAGNGSFQLGFNF